MMWNKWISLALFAAVLGSLVSIAVSEILFGMALLLWIGHCWSRREIHLKAPPFAGFVLIFVLSVLLSILFSADVLVSAGYLRKLLKFMYVFLIFTYLDRRQADRLLQAVFAVMGLSALLGAAQYFWLMDVTLLNRIRGFMGHWMTFSGQLMLVLVALAAYLLWYRFPEGGRRAAVESESWNVPSGVYWALFVLQSAVLVLTQTRSMLLGAMGGVLLLLWLSRPRKVFAALALLVIGFLLLPAPFKQRLYSGLDLQDTTTRIRIELIRTGARMVAEHPWTGLGPRMVSRLHGGYHESGEFPDWAYQHLHNNFVQLAAEMGLITLAAWLALWIRVLRDSLRLARSRLAEDPWRAAAAFGSVGAVVAFLLGGTLEYNFGDSEILILLLCLITIPHVGDREKQKTS